MSIQEENASGRLPNLDSALWIRESVIASGAAEGTRAIDVRPWGGIGCRVYPDRGLDIGQAWFGDTPLAWTSQVGESGPLQNLEGMSWGEAFGGGLLVTCGMRNVGMPSEGHGLHGTYSHLPASDVRTGAVVGDQDAAVVITGVVHDEEPPAPLQLQRTIRIAAGRGRIDVEDLITNTGDEPAEAPLLYHCNFGYPLWSPPAHLRIPAVAATHARDTESEVALDTWHIPPSLEVAPERVLEHVISAGTTQGQAMITNSELGIAVEVGWDRAELPRLNQWLDPNPGMAVLGIEPANCSTRGRSFDRASGALPWLQPGEARITHLWIEARGV
ncbi:MAG: DUF4432 family protein [Acidimicrobiia bacterium]|nr:DUF4432 family protein [Acidimicrobiia bacterium]